MKFKPIFITATNTDIGKTYAAIKLIEHLGKKGLKVGVLKPIETGVEQIPLDGYALLEAAQKSNPNLKKLTFKDIVPIQFTLPAAPFVAKKNQSIQMDTIKEAFLKIQSISDIVIIEGAGGLMVPIDERLYMYDFIQIFDAITLLVTHAKLGNINDTLLNINLLESLKVDYQWCVNFRDNKDDFQKITMPYYEHRFEKVWSLQDHIELLSESLLKSI